VTHGLVYLQVSRGAHPRDLLFPPPDTPLTVVCLARRVPPGKGEAAAAKGIAIKTVPDNRWERCDIKTVMLLPSSLAKEAARAESANDAWFVDADGLVTEGASSNAWIVDKRGRLITRAADDHSILRGVTRTTLIDLLRQEGIELVERPFTVAEATEAREAFLTSATNVVMPVVQIDGRPIGNGAPGLLTLRLRAAFHNQAELAGT
jgi:D-alanine transaminase